MALAIQLQKWLAGAQSVKKKSYYYVIVGFAWIINDKSIDL